MDANKVSDILKKYESINKEVETLEKQSKELNNELVRQQTLLNQNLEELKKYNISPDNLEKEIEKLSLEIDNDINEYNKLATTAN